MISSDGAGRRAIARILNERHGVLEEHMNIPMSGKTDPQILHEILSASKIEERVIADEMPRLLELYLGCLENEIKNATYYIIHKGIVELIAALSKRENVYLGLLTGNIERGARMKLARFDLNKHFEVGAYGSDSPNRLDLPAIAKERAEQHFGIRLEPDQLVIIGDAVNDILCAQGYGAKCIAVNTGKTTWEDLEALKPQFLFHSLENTKEIVEAVLAPTKIAC